MSVSLGLSLSPCSPQLWVWTGALRLSSNPVWHTDQTEKGAENGEIGNEREKDRQREKDRWRERDVEMEREREREREREV